MISTQHTRRIAACLTLGVATVGSATFGLATSHLPASRPAMKTAPAPKSIAVKTAAANCDCGNVRFANFQGAATAGLNAVWLDSLDLSKMSSGWQRPLAAKSVGGASLKLGGIVYPHGVGTHATSQFAVEVNGASRFVAVVGVDDETAGKGSVGFEVYTDGKLAFNSQPMQGGDKPQRVSIDLRGVKQLILRVNQAEDGDTFDHADWAGAMLVYPAGVAPQPQPVDAPEMKSLTATFDETPIAIAPASVTPLAPRINGPRVTGATPNRPFLFRIAATGQAPLVYSAHNLPAGLTVDSSTGIISGALQKVGTTIVKLEVKGAKGAARRDLAIVAGAHKLSQTPPLGWNSWNIFWCEVDEAKVRSAADWMSKTGLDRHGFQYINIDDCWQGERDAEGNIQVNPKFGNMKALGNYIHAKGLKYGIYSSPGPKTCANHTGSWQHEAQDVRSYAAWGVDYLKYDWCSYGSVATGEGLERAEKPYRTMRQALDNGSRDIVYSLCQYGDNDVWKWGDSADVKGNLWRTTGDIGASYGSMITIGTQQPRLSPYGGPGHWNDPDMLFLHALKPNEQITHLTIWSMVAAPLLIGSDLSKLPRFTLDALSNDEMIAIDQDPLGIGASVVGKKGFTEVWSRPLWNGTRAVAFINRGVEKASIGVQWKEINLQGAQPVRDVWRQKDLGLARSGFSANVPPHGALMFVVGRPNRKEYVPR